MTQDPFSKATPRVSAFASADSFRGRLVLIEPTRIEHDVPKDSADPAGARGDRITADVTTVDGLGPVQIFTNRVATGRFLEGPTYRKVWFGQNQILDGLQTEDGKSLLPMVLCRLDTLRPGQPQGRGNPWVVNDFSEEDAQMARDFLAGRKIAQASAPTPQQAAPAAPQNPWATQQQAPF